MAKKKIFTPWSSLDNMMGKLPAWWPEEEQQRIGAYEKYDQLYWNDPTQYAIRVFEGEQPIYIPNARRVVDVTAHYLLKGLDVYIGKKGATKTNAQQEFLTNFFKRERFFSKFHIAKQAGIARGDWAFHITADPEKIEGSRVSITILHPGMVWKIVDDDDPDKVIRIHIVDQWIDPADVEKKVRIKKLTYSRNEKDPADTTVFREEAIYELTPDWFGPTPKKVKQLLKLEALPSEITQFPVYWFPNIEWESQLYGSSEIRGLEFLAWAVSQGATDVEAALALEGLGVYATDGGRPVDEKGSETDWEVAPGKVMEVPQGSYFRRVEGVGSIKPMMDQIDYLERKMYESTGLSDVALGNVDVQVAQSGIALAIKFMPTLAKIQHRDTAGVEITTQMFFDLKAWFAAYESMTIAEDINVTIDESKLPVDRVAKVNELNNMLDRSVISVEFYRVEMEKLGYVFPDNMDTQIAEEAKRKLEATQLGPGQNDPGANLPPGSDPQNGSRLRRPSRSNNRNKPNESKGTESGQTLNKQAGG